jgi:hypothetical protein
VSGVICIGQRAFIAIEFGYRLDRIRSIQMRHRHRFEVSNHEFNA